MKQVYQIMVEYTLTEKEDNQVITEIQKELEEKYKCKILKFQTRRKEQTMHVELLVRTAKGNELIGLAQMAEKYPEITKISI